MRMVIEKAKCDIRRGDSYFKIDKGDPYVQMGNVVVSFKCV